jgi:hypothetical protein
MQCAASSRSVSARPPGNEGSQFLLCHANVKSLILAKVPGDTSNWEFIITLNSTGAQQFRELEEEIPEQLIDIVWADISFGTRRSDLPVQPGAKSLVLGSRWFNIAQAHTTFDLLNKRLLQKQYANSPCGAR